MTTPIEYALLAGASYYDTREDINRFPVPQDWSVISRYPEDSATGFEASAFKKSLSNEIVISYAGTDGFVSVDSIANSGLATGWGSDQLLQAAEYYLSIKYNPLYQGCNITLTGHSMGGGLAALIGVFFKEQAVTFDQAPFANSAELNLLTPDVAAELKQDLIDRGYNEAYLSELTNFLQLREANGGIPNSGLISTHRVAGEFSANLGFDTIGTENPPITHGDYFGPFDLHSQSLLTAFLQSDATAVAGRALNDVTFTLTDLLAMIFDDRLFEHPTDKPKVPESNYLCRLS